MRCTGVAALQGGQCFGRVGPRRRNREFVVEARSSRPPRPQTCRGLALGQRLIASPCSAADLNNSGRGPSRRVPRCREGSAMPGERSDAGRRSARIPCGGSAKVSAADAALARPRRRRIDRGQRRDAATGSTKSAGPPVGSARPPPRAPQASWPQRHATMTKGRRRLKYALIITTTIACPVGLDNGEVCSGPRRVCGTRFKRY